MHGALVNADLHAVIIRVRQPEQLQRSSIIFQIGIQLLLRGKGRVSAPSVAARLPGAAVQALASQIQDFVKPVR